MAFPPDTLEAGDVFRSKDGATITIFASDWGSGECFRCPYDIGRFPVEGFYSSDGDDNYDRGYCASCVWDFLSQGESVGYRTQYLWSKV